MLIRESGSFFYAGHEKHFLLINAKHCDPHDPDAAESENMDEWDGMFRFEKKMK